MSYLLYIISNRPPPPLSTPLHSLFYRNGAKVTLYESEPTFGGHTLTDDSSGHPVDLGFQVYNLTTYPNLVGFLEQLGVDTEPSDMSFSLSVDGGRLEWASHSLDTVFAQRSNLLSPTFLLMLKDVLRFGKEAPEVLPHISSSSYGNNNNTTTPDNNTKSYNMYKSMTLGDYLKVKRYSKAFIDDYLLPMCAAVWSVSTDKVLSFPVVTLVRFWVNHHLLDLTQRPCWRVVCNRSRSYVDKVVSQLPDVRAATPVDKVIPKSGVSDDDVVKIVTEEGTKVEEYDEVVLATHSDVSLKLLGGKEAAPAAFAHLLAAVPYSENDVWLHRDASLMPKRRTAWASWNCLQSSSKKDKISSINSTSGSQEEAPVCVTYWINSLQSLPATAPDLFVTLNPPTPPAPDTVYRHLTLSHPMFSFASDTAQAALPGLNGKQGIWMAGAWCGYGFHEDGINSAIAVVVDGMGGKIPWAPRATNPKMSWLDSVAMKTFDKFAKAAINVGRLRIILPNGHELIYGPGSGTTGITTTTTTTSSSKYVAKPPLEATIRLFNTTFFKKIITRHDTGMGESYMDGDYEVDNLGALLAVATANAYNIQDKRGMLGVFNWIGDKMLHLAHMGRSNTAAGSRRNIEEHYDAGNEMYKLFLDGSMTYSCGVWKRERDDGVEEEEFSLYDSQMAKIDALIDAAGIKAGDKVLEIGCGWGSFAMRCAQRIPGTTIVGLTVSKEQLAEAAARVEAAGLSDRIHLLFCDYRDCPGLGTYDRVVSCEMIEAVGHEHLEAYFITIGAALKLGGTAALQVIATPDERYNSYRNASDFIREHIFPGGHLPCMGCMVDAARGTGLVVNGCKDIGPDYAVTLRAWREAWEEKKEDILALGYSEKFWKKYRFYFAYCEAGFDAKYIHTFQVSWKKDVECSLTRQQIQMALEKSKSGGGTASSAAADSTAVDPSTALIGAALASTGLLSSPSSTIVVAESNPATMQQVILALYFFLIGLAVSRSVTLWAIPLGTLLSAMMYAMVTVVVTSFTSSSSPSSLSKKWWVPSHWVTTTTSITSGGGEVESRRAAALIGVDAARLVYSFFASISVLTLLVLSPSIMWLMNHSDQDGHIYTDNSALTIQQHERGWLARTVGPWFSLSFSASVNADGSTNYNNRMGEEDVLVELASRTLIAASAGVFAFLLWSEVHFKRYLQRGYLSMLHFTILTCLFFAAAFKNEHPSFLCVTLLSEINSGVHLGSKLVGLPSSVANALDNATFLAFRAAPHAVLGLMVASSPAAFSRPLYWGLGLAGMTHMNVANALQAIRRFVLENGNVNNSRKVHTA